MQVLLACLGITLSIISCEGRFVDARPTSKNIVSDGENLDQVRVWALGFSKFLKTERVDEDLLSVEKEILTAYSPPYEIYTAHSLVAPFADFSFYSDGRPRGFYVDRGESFTTPTVGMIHQSSGNLRQIADRIISDLGAIDYEYVGSAFQDSGVSGPSGSLGAKIFYICYNKKLEGIFSEAHEIRMAFDGVTARPFSLTWYINNSESCPVAIISAPRAEQIAMQELRKRVEKEHEMDVMLIGGEALSGEVRVRLIGIIPRIMDARVYPGCPDEFIDSYASSENLRPVWQCLFQCDLKGMRLVRYVMVDGITGGVDYFNEWKIDIGEDPFEVVEQNDAFLPMEDFRRSGGSRALLEEVNK